jgi:hypothetical protein
VILVLCLTTLRLRELLDRRWAEVHLDGPAPFLSVPHTSSLKGQLAGWTGLGLRASARRNESASLRRVKRLS